jgi:DNA-binding NtrC family response regulator
MESMTKVLIVEDQPAVAKALRLLFDLHDIESVTTSGSDAAMRALSRNAIDVVVQDMNFTPGATSGEEGIALFRSLRRADPDLPVVLLTAWTSLENAVQLVKEGASDYLAKPWDDAKLVHTIRSLAELRAWRKGEPVHSTTRDALRPYDLRNIVFESAAMGRVVSLALQVAPSEASVLITGPNGAGKEKIAEIIHANSPRRSKPFLKVNTGAIPEELLESELFGAEPGAFTGLTRLRVGRFEAASGGTLFFDEIANLSPAGQAKLLRVLQDGEFERLGSNEKRHADVRIVCATNADLHDAIARGRFRQDLYFRLNVIEIPVPPLRERREDIEPLARAFAAAAAAANRIAMPEIGAETIDALVAFDWPGNVRELQNRITRAIVTSRGEPILPEHLGIGGAPAEREVPLERKEIEFALLNAQGSVSRAAASLGVSRQALYRKMEKLGIVLERRPKGSD